MRGGYCESRSKADATLRPGDGTNSPKRGRFHRASLARPISPRVEEHLHGRWFQMRQPMKRRFPSCSTVAHERSGGCARQRSCIDVGVCRQQQGDHKIVACAVLIGQ